MSFATDINSAIYLLSFRVDLHLSPDWPRSEVILDFHCNFLSEEVKEKVYRLVVMALPLVGLVLHIYQLVRKNKSIVMK